MKKILFEKTFKKAKQQSGRITKNGIASYLENVFEEELNFKINRITFSRYYEQYIENKTNRNTNPSLDFLNKLAEYLEYNNYEDFVKKNETQLPTTIPTKPIVKSKILHLVTKYRIPIATLLVFFIPFGIIEFTEQRWMVWKETEYVEVDFDLDKYDFNQLKIYDEKKVKNFKKVTVDCKTTNFKKPNGKANIWYQKNNKKEIEFFSEMGYHPENDKPLKPITDHIIDKYICNKDSLIIQNK